MNTRRDFIKTGLLAGMALAPFSKAFGSNKQYRFDPDWPGKDSPHVKSRGIDADSFGKIYVAGDKKHPVMMYSPEGKYLGSWDKGPLPSPHGLRINNDLVWVTDLKRHQALQFTLEGKLLKTLGKKKKKGDAPDRFNRPTDFAFSKSGDIYISDGYKNTRVVCYGPDHKVKKIWGSKGDGKSEFDLVHAVAIGADDRVYVADRENLRVQIFDLDGKYLTEWNHVGKPYGLYTTADSKIFICGINPDTKKLGALLLDLSGKIITEFGDAGEGPGEFLMAHSIYVDETGRVYIADGKIGRVQRFLPTN